MNFPKFARMKIKIRTQVVRQLADTLTPVAAFLKLRDAYPNPVLLESNDFKRAESTFSYIGLDPIAHFRVQLGSVFTKTPDGEEQRRTLTDWTTVPNLFRDFIERFAVDSTRIHGAVNGFFGHTAFDGVQYFDTVRFSPDKRRFDLPDLNYMFHRFILIFNHFKDELYILENISPGEDSQLPALRTRLQNPTFSTYAFERTGSETSNITDREFKTMVERGKHHCQVGDVFQLVLSRQFEQGFRGDDFQVYRALRSINPSPSLYYFDCGTYRIFGSSPEAQMIIKDQRATVNPIAGTYRRTGDAQQDRASADALLQDPKENAEHIMLVDLARNDLGRHSTQVEVKELKEIQYFSHVIHLTSKVEGQLDVATNPIQVFGDTFPAGTLSGAPKYRALQLIDRYENQNRAFYGGALGYVGFDGNMNQAIVIRSFLSRERTLYYQAGAGIVISSDEESELQEVNNKLGALRKALEAAEQPDLFAGPGQ